MIKWKYYAIHVQKRRVIMMENINLNKLSGIVYKITFITKNGHTKARKGIIEYNHVGTITLVNEYSGFRYHIRKDSIIKMEMIR